MKKFCYSCFMELGQTDQCLFCGFDLKKYEEGANKRILVGTLLAGRYVVGICVRENKFDITYKGWDIKVESAVAIKEYFPSMMVDRDRGLSNTVNILGGKEKIFEEFLDHYKKEARNLNDVSILDSFNENETTYFVIPFSEEKGYVDCSNEEKTPWDAIEGLLNASYEKLEKEINGHDDNNILGGNNFDFEGFNNYVDRKNSFSKKTISIMAIAFVFLVLVGTGVFIFSAYINKASPEEPVSSTTKAPDVSENAQIDVPVPMPEPTLMETEPPLVEFEMPNLVGDSLENALTILSETDPALTVKTVEVLSGDEYVGKVVSQSMEPGKYKKGTNEIILDVGIGVEKIKVPNVTGKDSSVAKKELEAASLNVVIKREYDSSAKKGVVISQSIEAGMDVPLGETVEILVSKGSKPTNIPRPTKIPTNTPKPTNRSTNMPRPTKKQDVEPITPKPKKTKKQDVEVIN